MSRKTVPSIIFADQSARTILNLKEFPERLNGYRNLCRFHKRLMPSARACTDKNCLMGEIKWNKHLL